MEAKKLVDILGWIYVVFAGLGILSGIMLLFVGPTMLVMMAGMGMGEMGLAGGILTILGVLVIIIEGFVIWSALELMKHKSWARTVILIFSVLGLLSFPLGTAIGAFAIWLLWFNKDAVALFEGTPAEAPAEAPAEVAETPPEGEIPPELPEESTEVPPELPAEEPQDKDA